MSNKRKYWLTKATKSLTDAYDFLSEATSLEPTDETFDENVQDNLDALYGIQQHLELLKDTLK